jgi:hypothetical protein
MRRAIIRRRLDGMEPGSIAASLKCGVGEVRETVRAWSYASLPADRVEALALVIGRIEEVVAVVAPLARSGNTKAQQMLLKACALEAGMLGLYSPMIAGSNTTTMTTNNTLVFGARPTMTGTDRIEAALNALLADQKRGSEAATVVEEAEHDAAVPLDTSE